MTAEASQRAGSGAALVVDWHVPSEMLEQFAEWYDREHIPDRLRLGGFLGATRFAHHWDPTRQLCCFDLSGLDALDTSSYRDLSATRTKWTQQILRRCDVVARLECRVELEYGTADGALSSTVAWLAEVPAGPARPLPASDRSLANMDPASGVERCRLLAARGGGSRSDCR